MASDRHISSHVTPGADGLAPRILMVDDTAQNLQLLGTILRQEGYRLSAARNGREALESVAVTAPDLILLDVMMPELDGYETCQRLKADPDTSSIPVLFLTSRVEPQDILRGFEVGGVDYIQKPFSPPELLMRVRTHLELKAARDKLQTLASNLGKYLSPQVYASLFKGDRGARIESYRKDLTVCFTDIVSFTQRTESTDHNELTQWLNAYLDAMSRIALQHGGTVDKFIGDAVMVFFGDPVSRGVVADAAACVAMAQEMVAKARTLDAQIRVGIASGPCTVGNFGSQDRMTYTIVGSTVNRAARLQVAAAPGEILTCGQTWTRVSTQFAGEARGELMLKGMPQPTPSWRLFDA